MYICVFRLRKPVVNFEIKQLQSKQFQILLLLKKNKTKEKKLDLPQMPHFMCMRAKTNKTINTAPTPAPTPGAVISAVQDLKQTAEEKVKINWRFEHYTIFQKYN